ncbi:MAG: RNA polymerase sigma factor [Planctomycetota bacterium]
MAEAVERRPIELEPALVQRALAGERAAFDQIVERLWGPVFVYVDQRVNDRERARDLTQETFLQAFAKRGDVRRDGSLVSWVFAIASRKVIDLYRRAHLDPGPVARDEGREPRDPAAGPEESLETQEESARLKQAVAGLDDLYRTVLILRYWSGLTPAQIARALAEPEGTIRNRLFRAHRRLREILDPKAASSTVAPGSSKTAQGAPATHAEDASSDLEEEEPLVGSKSHEENSP